ncbi:Inward rectifier potassium channel activity protein [Halocaridina rubra]|uniref:G protein-activated inward rectifier potassium channel 3 n=1 Tax=Halocaridina rubra TaxID=373956 RepID=A0AAN9A701_HALRR
MATSLNDPALQKLMNGRPSLPGGPLRGMPKISVVPNSLSAASARLLTACSRKDIIRKNGDLNITYSNLKKGSRYLQDLYTTLVDVQWRWTLLVFFLAFIMSWLGFAFIWFMIIKVHGDDMADDENHIPCVSNVKTFTGSFLFSIETQHTIGYGFRYTTEECPEAVFVMCIQSITGVILQASMVGVVFAKLTRPKQRTNTLMFSRHVCICLRDGQLCLMFRVGDMRKTFIIGASVFAQVIRKRTTQEGEVIPYHQYDVKVGSDDGSDNLFFIWPMTIVHVIDENSPFYKMSAVDLMSEKFELEVYLEGTTESTGTTMQARCSYQPTDFLWGHRFENLIFFDKTSDNYVVDFKEFNKTVEVSTPLCSARDLKKFKEHNGDAIMRYTPSNSDQAVCIEPDLLTSDENNAD